MNSAAPIVAMLWENWRLTRVEAAQRFGLGIVLGAAALTLSDAGATHAFWILIVLHGMAIWMSIAKLNGGRFMEGYKPGFPFYLFYTRPVPTVVFVGVAMAYDAISCAALYLISAALLGFAFGQPLPLLSVALWIVAFHLAYACVQWSTPSRGVQWGGSFAFGLPMFLLLQNRMASPLQVAFSLAENTLFVLIGIVSFGLTVAGVARQRRGDSIASALQAERSVEYPDWLVNLFRFSCPTSSATRALVWFELKSSGLPVLAIGLALAMLIFLLFAFSIAIAPVRHAAVAVPVFSVLIVLLLGGNAFGIRRRQGRTYASVFEMSQPYGTAQMVGLKLLVRTSCVLVALIVVGVSVWVSSSLLGAWGPWLVEGGKDAVPEFLELRRKAGDAFGGMLGYPLATHAVITSVAVAVSVALLAAFAAVRARYPRRLLIAGALLLFHSFVLVLLALVEDRGIATTALVGAVFAATGWTILTAMICATLYFFWSGFAEQALTIRYASGALVIAAAFGAAWLTVLHAAGLHPVAMSTADAAGYLWPVLLLLMASVLAPWSLSRIRHI